MSLEVLFDHNILHGLKDLLAGHDVLRASEKGWSQLQNGELIAAAQADGFDMMLTADQSIYYQQSSKDRKIALVVLNTNRWELIALSAGLITESVERAYSGSYELVQVRASTKPTR